MGYLKCGVAQIGSLQSFLRLQALTDGNRSLLLAN